MDMIFLEFEYIVSDFIVCIIDCINIEVCLIVISLECVEGESCCYFVEFLIVIFKFRVWFSSEFLVCINDFIIFINESCNVDFYVWDFDVDGVIDFIDFNFEFSFFILGSYMVSLMVINECGSDVC